MKNDVAIMTPLLISDIFRSFFLPLDIPGGKKDKKIKCQQSDFREQIRSNPTKR